MILMKLKIPNFGSLPNQNLLDNGDFQIWQYGESFTINQDKQQMTASRWWCWSTQGHIVEKNANGGIKVTTKNATCGLYQYLENDLEDGEDYTVSALINGTLKSFTFTYDSSNYENIGNSNFSILKATNERVRIGVVFETNKSSICKYVKLERGKFATPLVSKKYSEEWTQCCRYYAQWYFAFAMTNSYEYNVSFPIKMRTTPSYTFSEVRYGTNSGKIKTSFTDSSDTGVQLMLIDSNLMRFKQNYQDGVIAVTCRVILDAEIS